MYRCNTKGLYAISNTLSHQDAMVSVVYGHTKGGFCRIKSHRFNGIYTVTQNVVWYLVIRFIYCVDKLINMKVKTIVFVIPYFSGIRMHSELYNYVTFIHVTLLPCMLKIYIARKVLKS